MTVENERDFDAFYGSARRNVIMHVYAMTGNLAEAEDCVQEAFARAWQQWGKLTRQSGSLEGWVRTVATRLAISSWRQAASRLSAHRREHEAGEVAGMSPDHVAVVAALRKIPVAQRQAIVLYHFAGLSIEEIAAETGAGANAVKARLSRGRAALVPHLSEFERSLTGPAPRPSVHSQPTGMEI
jgi:RNA polymerase sigma-70 factor (ECF subfamily)